MIRRFCTLGLAAFIACAAPAVAAPTDAEVAAHKLALDVATAFTNDGFKIRDGTWTGALESGKSKLVQVNLYAGNEYWFSAGTSPGAKSIAVNVFDENGKPLESEPFNEDGKAAAGFAPEVSGPYYIKIELLEGAPTTFCLIYSYK
jgi:hypothetical protein